MTASSPHEGVAWQRHKGRVPDARPREESRLDLPETVHLRDQERLVVCTSSPLAVTKTVKEDMPASIQTNY